MKETTESNRVALQQQVSTNLEELRTIPPTGAFQPQIDTHQTCRPNRPSPAGPLPAFLRPACVADKWDVHVLLQSRRWSSSTTGSRRTRHYRRSVSPPTRHLIQHLILRLCSFILHRSYPAPSGSDLAPAEMKLFERMNMLKKAYYASDASLPLKTQLELFMKEDIPE